MNSCFLYWVLPDLVTSISVLVEGPSEQKRAGSGDATMSKALIGSHIFCQRVRATHCENPATAKVAGLFGKMAKTILLWTIIKVQTLRVRVRVFDNSIR